MVTRARSRYEITADDKTDRALRNIRNNINSVHGSFMSLKSAVIGVAGAAGFGALIKGSLEAADAIGKQADAIGLTTDEYQEFVFAADKAGITQNQFNSNLTAFVKRVGEAREGVGPLTSFMRKYDEQVFQNIVNSRSQEEALRVVSEAIRDATDAAERAAIANAAFGRSGINMVNLLDDGAQAMEAWRQRARELGLVMDESLIRNSERAGDQLSTLSDVLSVRLTSALVELAPEIEAISTLFIELLKDTTAFFSAVSGFKSPVQELEAEIIALAAQRDALVDMRRQRMQSAVPDWVQRTMGLESPEELLAKLNEVNEIVLSKQKELAELLRPAAPTEGEPGGIAAPAIPAPAVQDFGIDQEKLLERFEVINLALLTEEEQLKIHFENSRLIIEDAYVTGIIPTEMRYRELMETLEAQHQGKMAKLVTKGLTQRQKFTQMSMGQQVKTVAGELHKATVAVATENEVMFRLNQASGIANTIMTTIEGANRAFKDFPYPIALGIATAVGLAGAVNVAAIASQSIGGGSAAPSLAAQGAVSGPVPTFESSGIGTQQDAVTAQQVNITLNGTGYSKQDVRDLIESINEEIGDGLVLETN